MKTVEQLHKSQTISSQCAKNLTLKLFRRNQNKAQQCIELQLNKAVKFSWSQIV